MKLFALIFVSCLSMNLYASLNLIHKHKCDSCLLIENDKDSVFLEKGDKILIRTGIRRFKGNLSILNDSIVLIGEKEILLEEIDMIAKPRTKKTVLLFIAQSPLTILGLWSTSIGGYVWVPIGLGIIGTGVTVAAIEANKGKRYRRYNWSKTNQIQLENNWNYSIIFN